MRKEKKEEKTNTPKLSYAKGLSHAVLKYLEEEETKAFMEKIEKNEEEEEEGGGGGGREEYRRRAPRGGCSERL